MQNIDFLWDAAKTQTLNKLWHVDMQTIDFLWYAAADTHWTSYDICICRTLTFYDMSTEQTIKQPGCRWRFLEMHSKRIAEFEKGHFKPHYGDRRSRNKHTTLSTETPKISVLIASNSAWRSLKAVISEKWFVDTKHKSDSAPKLSNKDWNFASRIVECQKQTCWANKCEVQWIEK